MGINPQKLVLNPTIYPDQTQPHGRLVPDLACQGCWSYYLIAQTVKEKVGNGSIDEQFGLYDDERWQDTHYLQQARSTALRYGVSLEDMFRYWELIRQECVRLKLPEPAPVYMNPLRFII